jgi:hypothetical protein
MHINYINDRQELGFSCIKNIDAIKQLFDFKNTLLDIRIQINQAYPKKNY